ncbi:hypothetical protein DRJ17_02680 [Candidatus Woesearchaeota archaeon]|nr:MAG: hypothetical protein DRJ17_02680 [Candidatus Woesearchaeota archaeon]
MTFDFNISDELKIAIRKLSKKDKARVLILNRKIREIISCDISSIEKYKNLRYGLKEYKRVHIDRSFVLIFKVFKDKRFILFDRLVHHDKVYKR